MANKKTQHIIGASLMLCSTFAGANTQSDAKDDSEKQLFLDTTSEVHTKHYPMGDYNINGDSVSFRMSYDEMATMFAELKQSSQKFVAFSSENLGQPNKQSCAYISFGNEKLRLKNNFLSASADISINNVNTNAIPVIQQRNCVAVDRKTLIDKATAQVPRVLRWILQ